MKYVLSVPEISEDIKISLIPVIIRDRKLKSCTDVTTSSLPSTSEANAAEMSKKAEVEGSTVSSIAASTSQRRSGKVRGVDRDRVKAAAQLAADNKLKEIEKKRETLEASLATLENDKHELFVVLKHHLSEEAKRRREREREQQLLQHDINESISTSGINMNSIPPSTMTYQPPTPHPVATAAGAHGRAMTIGTVDISRHGEAPSQHYAHYLQPPPPPPNSQQGWSGQGPAKRQEAHLQSIGSAGTTDDTSSPVAYSPAYRVTHPSGGTTGPSNDIVSSGAAGHQSGTMRPCDDSVMRGSQAGAQRHYDDAVGLRVNTTASSGPMSSGAPQRPYDDSIPQRGSGNGMGYSGDGGHHQRRNSRGGSSWYQGSGEGNRSGRGNGRWAGGQFSGSNNDGNGGNRGNASYGAGSPKRRRFDSSSNGGDFHRRDRDRQ